MQINPLMNRPPALLWLLLLLLLLPTAAGRVLLDLAGGVVLVLIALPLLLTGVGWIGWKILQSRLITCPACGSASLGQSSQCGVCGASLQTGPSGADTAAQAGSSVPASEVTIDVTAQDAGSDS